MVCSLEISIVSYVFTKTAMSSLCIILQLDYSSFLHETYPNHQRVLPPCLRIPLPIPMPTHTHRHIHRHSGTDTATHTHKDRNNVQMFSDHNDLALYFKWSFSKYLRLDVCTCHSSFGLLINVSE